MLTGNAPRKKREFVFLDNTGVAPPDVAVPVSVWDRFHDPDQITQWQERAFPRHQPPGAGRRASGHLRNGEPVFYLTDHASVCDENPVGLVFLGRAGMFRLPYDKGPADLVPGALTEAELDLAEAMFGKVDRRTQIKGRVQFEDALAIRGGPDWFEEELTPKILSAPKPTAFQHYLTQEAQEAQEAQEKDRLKSYIEGDQTAIRGHKLYWHRWDAAEGIFQVKERNIVPEGDTQHTVIQPVRAGVTFSGRVRFENLTTLELGALLEALLLPEVCCHKLGMGKPLGLGSIRISGRLRLVDRAARYASWQASGVRENEHGQRFREGFCAAILQHARASGEPLVAGGKGLREIGRLDALYRMLDWENRPTSAATAGMDIKTFKERPVLPMPHAVAGAPEPHAAKPAPSPAQPFKRIEKGQTRRGVLQRRDQSWVAVFDGDSRDAQIVNPNMIPDDCAVGATAEFYITEQSKRLGIQCRFEKIADL